MISSGLKGAFSAVAVSAALLGSVPGAFGRSLAESAAAAESGKLKFGGHFKTFAMGNFASAIEGAPSAGASTFQWFNALRINASLQEVIPAATYAEGSVSLELAYEAQPVWKKLSAATASLSALPLSRGAAYRLVDLDTSITESGNFILYQNLDRLNARWALTAGDLTVGRQAITFGSANVIQTTDVLLPFSFSQVNVEYRIGVDALRLQLPLGQLGELDVGLVAGEGARAVENAAFARVQANLAGADFVLQAVSFSGAKLLGGGMQSEIGELGFKADLAQVWAPRGGEENYFRLSAGLDGKIGENLLFFTEYHHNGAGSADPQAYSLGVSRFAYSRGGVFLLGRDYLIPGVLWQLTPLSALRAQVIANLGDDSLFVSPSMTSSLSEVLSLDVGGYIGIGKGMNLGEGGFAAASELRSEFGSYPRFLYAAFNLYF